jgi:hypothetical protein
LTFVKAISNWCAPKPERRKENPINSTLRMTALLLMAADLASPALAQRVKLGDGAYWLSTQGSDRDPPAASHRTPALLATAAQTNQ